MGATGRVAVPLASGIVSFGTIWACQNFLPGNHEVILPLNTILSTSVTAMVAAIGGYLDPKTEPQNPPPQEIPLPPEQPGTNWREEYRALYARAKQLLQDRDRSKQAVEDELLHTKDEVIERKARMKITLYCGLAFSIASCVATLASKHMQSSADAFRDMELLAGVYFAVALVFGFCTLLQHAPPRRPMPILMFGICAIYVTTCALLISVPYNMDTFFGKRVHTLFGVMHLVTWVALARLLVLPAAAMIGAIVGIIGAGSFRRATS